MTQWNVSERAARVLDQAVACDLIVPWIEPMATRYELLPRYRASGFTFMGLTVGGVFDFMPQAVLYLARERARLEGQADRVVFVEKADDVLRAKREGKLAVSFNFQGTDPFQADLALVGAFQRLGLRQVQLTYNQKNHVGDGCHERTDAGLSGFGVKLVEALNRAGIIVDVTHVGRRSSMEAIEVSRAPVIFSHSNPRALNDHDRNIGDDQIRACARTGGVIGINGVGVFLGRNDATTESFLRHVQYVAKLVGPEHVALGLDVTDLDPAWLAKLFAANPEAFPGYPPPPWNFFQPEQLPALVEAMLAAGFGEADVTGILGGNYLRVARAVWG